MTRSLCLALVTLASLPARADIMPEGQKRVGYTYEITNLQASPDLNIVLWPRSCGSDGSPEGKIDLALNPQYAAHMHDVDYEVVRLGRHHKVGKFCEETSRFYGLSAKAFPVDQRVAKTTDWRIGWTEGEGYGGMKALDAIALDARIPFFKSDPRVARATLKLDVPTLVPESSAVQSVHDVLALEPGAAGTLKLVPRFVVYQFTDGKQERLAYPASGRRPTASRR